MLLFIVTTINIFFFCNFIVGIPIICNLQQLIRMLASKSQSAQTLKKLQKSKKDYRFFYFDDTFITFILRELQYPSLQQYCYQCSKEITPNTGLACHLCLKAVHRQCKKPLKSTKSQVCRFCVNNVCLKCHMTMNKYARKVKCSICLKHQHMQCWDLPFTLLQETKKFYSGLKNKMTVVNRIVCQQCKFLWGISSQIMAKTLIQNQTYNFIKVNHPSPIHYAWLTQEQYQLMRATNFEDEDVAIIENKQPAIENIFSLHLLPQYNSLSLGCIYKLLHEQKIEDDSVFFLVKWQDREQLVWQTLQTVTPYEDLIRNFFIQLNINWMRSKKLQIRNISRSLQYLILDELVYKKVSLLGNSNMVNDGRDKFRDSLLQRVYDLYSRSQKQSLLSRNGDEAYRVSVLCGLINTIIFVQKQLKPIFFFTSRSKIKHWFSNFQKLCIFHKCLMLTGSEQYLKTIMNKHFCCKSKKQIFYNAIYLIDYDSYQKILNFFSFKEVINFSTLVIMQEKMSFMARNLYDECKIAKIKLGIKATENCTSSDIKTYSLSQISHISLATFSNDSSKKGRFEPLGYRFKSILQQMQTKYNKNELFSQCKLDQLQRLSFLRFVMLFGLECQNSQNLTQELISFQKSTFQTLDQEQLKTRIQSFVKMFLTIVYASFHSELPSQMIKYFCSEIPPYEIFERIIVINQMKKLVQKYSKEFKLIAKEDKKGDFACCFEFNLMIFEAVVTKGFGKWQAISEFSKVWQEGTGKLTLRQYFCLKAGLNIGLLGFSELIKDRVMKLVISLKKSNFLV